ncbi:hypothetical protein OSB04_un000395 [Centaurea solstitialis]|uniref:Reverse transcriptase domain-containing protein n=1 Tax=Centaurea solstitialis TaxID=347529 RepID=A0AA38VRZ2_9ASTR|nr:hypothetical protein OSB04_un000395 [Centaurea solstitialis]
MSDSVVKEDVVNPSAHLGQIDLTMEVTDDSLSDNDMEIVQEKSQSTRVSVFDRLDIDDRLKINKEPTKNYAAAVGGTVSEALSFYPLADKTQSCVRIPVELATEVMTTHKATLFGYFLGPRLNFNVVERYVSAVWGKFGLTNAMMNNNGIYFFKFNDVGGSKQVVEAGPLMIRGVPLFVEHWEPGKALSKPIHNSCPLWVKLHNVPLVAFNKEGLSRIASALGVPKQLDACTASMCDKAWGRPGFAKVLVDIWAVGDLKRDLQVVIPSLSGGDDVRVQVKVEYLWEPTQCSHCLVFGHKTTSCAKAIVAQASKGKNKVVDVDGFTTVQRNEWRPKHVGSTSGSKGVTIVEKPTVALVDSSTVSGPSVVVQAHEVQENLGEQQRSKESLVTPIVVEDPPVEQNVVKDSMETGAGVLGGLKDSFVPNYVCTSRGTPDLPFKQSVVNTVKQYTARRGKFVSLTPTQGKPREERGTNAFSALADLQDSDDVFSGDVAAVSSDPKVTTVGGHAVSPLEGCWNIRGLNASDKQQEVRSFISNSCLHLCIVLESHVRREVLHTVCNNVFRRWPWFSNQANSDVGTRIILAWDLSVIDVVLIESHAQFLHCEVRFRDSDDCFFLSVVYGYNRSSDRRLLWSGLRKFKVLIGDKPWVVVGDFNCLLFPHDAYGGVSKRNGDMMDFAACVEDVEIFDVRFMGIHHTWCQKPKEESGLRRKLDRILANTEFTTGFHDATATFLPRGLSDHSPALLSFKGDLRKRCFGFKFDNFLVQDARFLQIVKEGWKVHVEGTFMFRLTSKLKNLKKPLRRLRSSYGNLTERTIRLKHELDVVQLAIDFDPSNGVLREDLEHLRDAYQQACWMDLSAVRQRAKVKWLMEADSNTKYFHHVLKEKRNLQHYYAVSNGEGDYVYGSDVALAFIDHFRSIIGTVDASVVPDMPEGLFNSRLSVMEANDMIRPIGDDEIKSALFRIGNDKAPGSDGFSSKFFKASWDVVGSDVLLAIHNFFYRGWIAKEINHTLLCLLPKSENATSVTDFRPIACCSVLYKCISKVIVDRMKPVLDKLVDSSQSAFIPGRKIGDNILMAHELVVGYHLNKGPPRCAFKIDLRKAYDMVSWDYLLCMLCGMGFHSVLIKWISEMIFTTSFSISLNGETFGHFLGKRGIRQGDPISPYLFTIVMEGFSMLFRQCVREAEQFGYHLGCLDIELTHLCFADDLFVFTRGDVASVGVLKKALDLFALRSGLSPNLQKSDVFFGNVPDSEKLAILECLPFREGSFPIRYLGVPLSPVALKVADYGVLLAKVRARVNNWKSKFLSFGGRRQLIISVLQSLQLYWMAVFLFPSGVVHELEACFRDFLWAQGNSSKGKCKVAWDLVCRPFDAGGLGIKRLSVWNRAILTKNLWAVVTRHQSLWVRSYILRGANIWAVRRNNRWSWLFTKLMSLRDVIRRFVSVRIGDGLMANAWEDTWLPCGPLSMVLPYRLFHASNFSPSTSVRQVLDVWDHECPPTWIARVPILATLQWPLLAVENTDSFCWDIDVAGHSEFTVRRAYNSLAGDSMLVLWSKKVWFKGHIPRHSFCLWLACLGRLPTQDRIANWKHDPPDMRCSLCQLCMDSHAHLFFECTYSANVWQMVRIRVGWMEASVTWDVMVHLLEDPSQAPKTMFHKLVLAASVYMIWKERNSRLFSSEKLPEIKIVNNILEVVQNRLAWKRRKRRLVDHGLHAG